MVVQIDIQAIFSMISLVWIQQSQVAVPQTAYSTVLYCLQPTARRFTFIDVGTDVANFTFRLRRVHNPFFIKINTKTIHCIQTMNKRTMADKKINKNLSKTATVS